MDGFGDKDFKICLDGGVIGVGIKGDTVPVKACKGRMSYIIKNNNALKAKVEEKGDGLVFFLGNLAIVKIGLFSGLLIRVGINIGIVVILEDLGKGFVDFRGFVFGKGRVSLDEGRFISLVDRNVGETGVFVRILFYGISVDIRRCVKEKRSIEVRGI